LEHDDGQLAVRVAESGECDAIGAAVAEDEVLMKRKILKIIGASLAVVTILGALSFAQDQTAPFQLRVSTQLVIQAVTVTDKDGKTLTGLTAEDFTLTEDNVPQNISVFEFQKIDDTVVPRPVAQPPQQLAAALQPPSTRITPVPEGDTRFQDRRLLAIYFDMSALDAIDRHRALTAAQAFIEKEMKGPRSRRALHLFRWLRSRPPRFHR
jgi:hypothetical protein